MIKRTLISLGGGTKTTTAGGDQTATPTTSSTAAVDDETEWEMRPGGMLVQKRADNADSPTRLIRVRVVFGSARFEISVNSQASFGELKKQLTAECGLQHWEQRLEFRGKERADKDFLDISGLKDRSKVVLTEDPCSREKRMVEMRRSGKIQRSRRALSDVSLQVDQLAQQVAAMERSVGRGEKVAEIQITTMIEMLMRQAVKLDAVNSPSSTTDAEISDLRRLQGKRVQRCVEKLDLLKIANAKLKAVVVTTKWETFEPPTPPTPQWNLLD